MFKKKNNFPMSSRAQSRPSPHDPSRSFAALDSLNFCYNHSKLDFYKAFHLRSDKFKVQFELTPTCRPQPICIRSIIKQQCQQQPVAVCKMKRTIEERPRALKSMLEGKGKQQESQVSGESKPRKKLASRKSIQKEVIIRLQKNLPQELSLRPLVNISSDKIKAQSYAVLDPHTCRLISSSKAHCSLEVASLTKIMTCFTVLQIVKFKSIDMQNVRHIVSAGSERMSGTSAQILSGQIFSVEQLLYGMMLPSGNDAAVALAEWAGELLLEEQESTFTKYEYPIPKERRQVLVRRFIRQMNEFTRQISLKNTRWANPHGLSDSMNKSSAYDLSIVSALALRDPVFRKIVSTQTYRTKISTVQGQEYFVQWENTNSLLRCRGFYGIKTGVTTTAGPCMASAFGSQGQQYVTVLLKTNKLCRRFKESKLILSETLKQLQRTNKCKKTEELLEMLQRRRHDSQQDSLQRL